MNILLLTQYFYPEIGAASARAFAHCRYWIRSGHRVKVVTSVPNSPSGIIYRGYKNKLLQSELIDGIEILRVLTLPAGKKQSAVRRCLSFLAYPFFSFLGIFEGENPDIVIASDPFLSGIPALATARLNRVPLVYEMRDLWIEAYLEKNRKPLVIFLSKILNSYERAIIKRCADVVVIGQDMAEYVRNKYSLTREPICVYNGTSVAIFREGKTHDQAYIVKKNLSNNFIIGFIGNLNNAYDIEVLVNSATLLRAHKCLFLFVGNGSQRTKLMTRVESLNLKNFRFFDPVPVSEIDSWFQLCDVTIVPLRSGAICHIYLPVKIFDSMAAGRSVLLGGVGEAKRIIERSGAGQVFLPGDSFGLCELIKERMLDRRILEKEGKAGKDFVFKHFTRERMAAKYIDIMRNIVNGKDSENATQL
jgi:glycosyltransferase involved in cell wall biosynthesis